jgi:mevalonate kinase
VAKGLDKGAKQGFYDFSIRELLNLRMIPNEPVNELAKELGLIVTDNNFSGNRQLLVEKVNALIEKDFQSLVSILYRMDVSEKKLTTMLNEQPDKNAAETIVDLMIERQLQKIKSRQQFSNRDENIDENEKW